MAENYNNIFKEEEEKPIDWQAVIMEYLIYWPYILIFLILTIIGAYVFLRFQTPTYNVNTTVLIKQGVESKSKNLMNAMPMMQDIGMFSMANNFDNEVEVIKSRTLIKKVVNTLNLYIDHRQKRKFGYATPLYKNTPVKVWMAPDEAEKLIAPIELELNVNPSGKFTVNAEYLVDIDGDKITQTKNFDKFPGIMITPVGTISFTAPSDSIIKKIDKTVSLEVTIESPTSIAKSCKNRLTGEPTSKLTTIIALNYTDSNIERGIDFLNTLVSIYNSDANDDKNEVASRSAQFISERIEIINKELGTTEKELAEYKQKAGLTNVKSDAELAIKGNAEYNQKRAENETQIRLVQFLREYIENPKNKFEVIPANVGLTDQGLTEVISRYNEMIIERQRLLRTSNEKNPAVVNLDIAIAATQNSVNTTVSSVEKGLLITRNNLNIEARKFEEKISSAPIQEKELINISRQQEIKANLYLMLLQKREENAITLASTANNGRIIEEPLYGGKTGPKSLVILFASLIFGFGFPIGCIYIIRLLRLNIEGRADVEKITDIPIVGDVPYIQKGKIKNVGIVIEEGKNNLMEEIFRSVRTNVMYMLESGKKVILVTSTISGEGKSFIAGNLATSFAFMGKKVLIMGMDIRKPGLNKIFNVPRQQDGITSYLASPETVNLMDLCQKSGINDNLYLIPGGIVPPNPTELVARNSFDKAIEELKEHFDYIILDTAPIGIVTDTQLISRVADLSIYVCRADYTRKSDYQLINELKDENKLPHLCTLINGIDMNRRRNGYYYGYGKYGKYGKYGYGKKYGYGYGYGYGK